MPSLSASQQIALRAAEDALAEAIEDEERKAREYRHCPNCGGLFAVLERHCGQFVCGRDAHGIVGHEVHGCGHTFQVDTARNYRVNEDNLEPLRIAVDIEQANLATHDRNKEDWERAKGMEWPTLLVFVEKHHPLVAPSVFLVDHIEESSESDLLLALMQAGKAGKHLSLLPDLIEVR